MLPDLLDPTATESMIARMNGLTVEQVAAVRGYILCHPDTVLARHLEIEERNACGNPPEVDERARAIHERFMRFREWYERQKREEAEDRAKYGSEASPVPGESYREWIMSQESRACET